MKVAISYTAGRIHLAVATGTVAAVVLTALSVGVAAAAPIVSGADTIGVSSASQPSARRAGLLPGTKCSVFPATSVWHSDVSALPTHLRSSAWMAASGAVGRNLHPDFGPAYGEQSVPYGIPITVVNANRATTRMMRRAPRTGKKPGAKVTFDYADESDQVRYPLSRKTKIEGGWDADGDRHAIVVDARACKLYETYDTRLTGGRWTAGSGAVWSLRSNALRPADWTSADAAGLAILPGLLRLDEVQAGNVDHAIRFTLPATQKAYIWPARHQAGQTASMDTPPMGARFRMRSDFDASGYSANARVILAAMKRHGLILADNGSGWFFQGTADEGWPDSLISELKTIPANSFEAIDGSSLQVDPNSGVARR